MDGQMQSRLVGSLPIAAALVALDCSRKKDQAPMAPAGAEAWVVDDNPYHIASTHYERGPGNLVVYVVRYRVPAGTPTEGMDMDKAAALVWPLVKHAYNNRTFERARIPPLKGSTPPAINLAIDLLSSDGARVLFRYEVPAGK